MSNPCPHIKAVLTTMKEVDVEVSVYIETSDDQMFSDILLLCKQCGKMNLIPNELMNVDMNCDIE